MQRATSFDGTEIAWDLTGAAASDTLLLIAGQGVDSASWDAVVPAFAPRSRVLRFDHRGTGRSAMGDPDGYSTRGFARDAVAVLDAARVDVAHVYGHSMGGRVAQWLAIDSADRVGALVLGATTAGDGRGVPRDPAVDVELASDDPQRMARVYFAGPLDGVDLSVLDRADASRRARRLHYQASREHDTWSLLDRIRAATLVLHGSDDVITPWPNGEMLAAGIPGAEFRLLRGGAHGFHLQHPDATRLVLEFLDAHPVSPAGQTGSPC